MKHTLSKAQLATIREHQQGDHGKLIRLRPDADGSYPSGDPNGNWWEDRLYYDPDILPANLNNIPARVFLSDRVIGYILANPTELTLEHRVQSWPGDFGSGGALNTGRDVREHVGLPAITDTGSLVSFGDGIPLYGDYDPIPGRIVRTEPCRGRNDRYSRDNPTLIKSIRNKNTPTGAGRQRAIVNFYGLIRYEDEDELSPSDIDEDEDETSSSNLGEDEGEVKEELEPQGEPAHPKSPVKKHVLIDLTSPEPKPNLKSKQSAGEQQSKTQSQKEAQLVQPDQSPVNKGQQKPLATGGSTSSTKSQTPVSTTQTSASVTQTPASVTQPSANVNRGANTSTEAEIRGWGHHDISRFIADRAGNTRITPEELRVLRRLGLNGTRFLDLDQFTWSQLTQHTRLRDLSMETRHRVMHIFLELQDDLRPGLPNTIPQPPPPTRGSGTSVNTSGPRPSSNSQNNYSSNTPRRSAISQPQLGASTSLRTMQPPPPPARPAVASANPSGSHPSTNSQTAPSANQTRPSTQPQLGASSLSTMQPPPPPARPAVASANPSGSHPSTNSQTAPSANQTRPSTQPQLGASSLSTMQPPPPPARPAVASANPSGSHPSTNSQTAPSSNQTRPSTQPQLGAPTNLNTMQPPPPPARPAGASANPSGPRPSTGPKILGAPVSSNSTRQAPHPTSAQDNAAEHATIKAWDDRNRRETTDYERLWNLSSDTQTTSSASTPNTVSQPVTRGTDNLANTGLAGVLLSGIQQQNGGAFSLLPLPSPTGTAPTLSGHDNTITSKDTLDEEITRADAEAERRFEEIQAVNVAASGEFAKAERILQYARTKANEITEVTTARVSEAQRLAEEAVKRAAELREKRARAADKRLKEDAARKAAQKLKEDQAAEARRAQQEAETQREKQLRREAEARRSRIEEQAASDRRREARRARMEDEAAKVKLAEQRAREKSIEDKKQAAHNAELVEQIARERASEDRKQAARIAKLAEERQREKIEEDRKAAQLAEKLQQDKIIENAKREAARNVALAQERAAQQLAEDRTALHTQSLDEERSNAVNLDKVKDESDEAEPAVQSSVPDGSIDDESGGDDASAPKKKRRKYQKRVYERVREPSRREKKNTKFDSFKGI